LIALLVKEFLIPHHAVKISGKNMLSYKEENPFSKNLKIFHLAQKMREEM